MEAVTVTSSQLQLSMALTDYMNILKVYNENIDQCANLFTNTTQSMNSFYLHIFKSNSL